MNRADSLRSPFVNMFSLINNDISTLQINENNEKNKCYLIDVNGDGVLSKDEIERGLQLAKDFKTRNDTDFENCIVGERNGMGTDLQTIFDVMDKDGSGGISILMNLSMHLIWIEMN